MKKDQEIEYWKLQTFQIQDELEALSKNKEQLQQQILQKNYDKIESSMLGNPITQKDNNKMNNFQEVINNQLKEIEILKKENNQLKKE